jgi:peptide deformylase
VEGRRARADGVSRPRDRRAVPETRTGGEGCLSIPGVLAQVERAAEIELAWRDLDGARHSRRFDGFAAICIQHEADHLDGIVTLDRLPPEARAMLEAAYAGPAA